MTSPRSVPAVLTRRVSHPEFVGPSAVLIFLGVASLSVGVLTRPNQVWLDATFLCGALSLMIGLLVARRTRLGTALFCILLLGSLVARVVTFPPSRAGGSEAGSRGWSASATPGTHRQFIFRPGRGARLGGFLPGRK